MRFVLVVPVLLPPPRLRLANEEAGATGGTFSTPVAANPPASPLTDKEALPVLPLALVLPNDADLRVPASFSPKASSSSSSPQPPRPPRPPPSPSPTTSPHPSDDAAATRLLGGQAVKEILLLLASHRAWFRHASRQIFGRNTNATTAATATEHGGGGRPHLLGPPGGDRRRQPSETGSPRTQRFHSCRQQAPSTPLLLEHVVSPAVLDFLQLPGVRLEHLHECVVALKGSIAHGPVHVNQQCGDNGQDLRGDAWRVKVRGAGGR